MNNELAIQNNNDVSIQHLDSSKIDLIRRTIAKDSTDDEFALFMTLAKKYNLDPFAKEIWFIKYGNKAPSIFTSRDGYLKIAHSNSSFDGIESYTIDDNNGNPIKAVCKVYRKDMGHPFCAEIKVSEYRQDSPTWKKYPSAMAIKVAEAFALKRAFSISGLVTIEEMPDKPANEQTQPIKKPQSPSAPAEGTIQRRLYDRVITAAKNGEMDKSEIVNRLKMYKKDKIKDLTDKEASELYNELFIVQTPTISEPWNEENEEEIYTEEIEEENENE